MTTSTHTRQITDKQDMFIRTLLDGRVVTAEHRVRLEDRLANRDMTTREASATINWLTAQPRIPATPTNTAQTGTPVTEPGIYERDGAVYRVKAARDTGNLYATVLVEIGGERVTEAGTFINAEYQYAPGVVRTLTAEDRMDTERAEALTIRYGMCVNCARHLKDAKSVQRGMGPVCAGKV